MKNDFELRLQSIIDFFKFWFSLKIFIFCITFFVFANAFENYLHQLNSLFFYQKDADVKSLSIFTTVDYKKKHTSL